MNVKSWNFFFAALLSMLLCMPAMANDTDVVGSFRDHVESVDVKSSLKSAAQKSIDAFAADSPADAIT